jgi:FAD/FMN-containing dehydrogenase
MGAEKMDSGERAIRALITALGPEKVVVDPEHLLRYRGIAWGVARSRLPLARPPAPPFVAVRPSSTADVVAVVQVAGECGTPIVPHGAGTGVHAGAAPVADSILLDLGAMNRILEIRREDRLARVEPGVVLGDLDHAAQALDLMVGHDPWSQAIATVGGAVSTNGVGYLAGKYGGMGDQVLGLEVVLATGEVMRTSVVPKQSTGPGLRNLFIGAEGVLGIITEVDLRLFGIPERRALAGYRFPRFEAGLAAVVEMEHLHLRPAMIDYEEDDPAEGVLRPGVLADLPSSMFFAFEGFAEAVAAEVARADVICRRLDGMPLPESETQDFWDRRHESADRWLKQMAEDPAVLASPNRGQRRSSVYLNVSLSPSAIAVYRERACRDLASSRLALRSAGLWGMPELFSIRFEHLEPDDPRARGELDQAADYGMRLAQELGGSMEYCHGVGLTLAHLMDAELGAGFAALGRIKQALDPQGLLNPGKLALNA